MTDPEVLGLELNEFLLYVIDNICIYCPYYYMYYIHIIIYIYCTNAYCVCTHPYW